MKIILIIPCFNDNLPLKRMLNSKIFRKISLDLDILVVDDGSENNISMKDIDINFSLIRNDDNKGKGYSIKKGFNYALNNGYTHAITLDADLQHDPEYIKKFINIDSKVDVVIGSRTFGGDMPLLRRFSNTITSLIVSVIAGRKINDSQSGYRRYRLKKSPFNKCIESGFQFESEILINTLKQKNTLLEHISIPTLYNNEKSSINNMLDTYKFIKLIIRKIIDR